MKRFIITILAVATVCTMSCTKENVNPESKTIKKTVMRSGGGDKIPSGTYD